MSASRLNRELLSLPLVTTAYRLLASYAYVTLMHNTWLRSFINQLGFIIK